MLNPDSVWSVENKQVSLIIGVWLATQTSVTSVDAGNSYFQQ